MDFKNIKNTIKGDFTGGLTAAIIALPMALAFGLQCNPEHPEIGLYTAIFLAIIASLVAGTKTLISDPTGPMTIIAAGVIASAGGAESGLSTIIVSFAFAGIFQILFGIIKVAQYVKYISYPVLSGFMGGIGIIIILFQWNSFFGDPPRKEIFDIIGHLPDPIIHHHWSAMILGLSTLEY